MATSFGVLTFQPSLLIPAPATLSKHIRDVNGTHRRTSPVSSGPVCQLGPARCQNTEEKSFLEASASLLTRRTLVHLGFATSLTLLSVGRSLADIEAAGAELELSQYSDLKDGFAFLVPSGWQKVDKSGATVLFEDPNKKSSTVGIVVLPVRISSLKDFGGIDVVAERLVEVEKKKQSTQEAKILQLDERDVREGVPLYAIDYTVDSTRGIKRFLTAVTIAQKKLYILNIAFKDSPAEPATEEFLTSMQRVRDSFGLSLQNS
eukprot:TRINITY_DN4581_c1_g1_i1.p1 TRINITY_DN4581_c1_g1~~TRINITY_DN4581_c1_g1_i1.p1  ORF type:complete len:286 (+),score=53.84 TRINITY_DN4581_c1_g1_i1:73-858(+)